MAVKFIIDYLSFQDKQEKRGQDITNESNQCVTHQKARFSKSQIFFSDLRFIKQTINANNIEKLIIITEIDARIQRFIMFSKYHKRCATKQLVIIHILSIPKICNKRHDKFRDNIQQWEYPSSQFLLPYPQII
ncbi:hypothetical protein pb186bvf_009400 [Paramecium bursaria]